MLVLKIIGGIVTIIAVIVAMLTFDNHCQEKFKYKFFTIISLVISAAGVLISYAGYSWYDSAVKSGGDILNGIIILSIGLIILTSLIYYNFKRTNLLYGVCGSAVQISVFGGIAYIGAFFFLLFIGLSIFVKIFGNIKPVWIINR